jgi:HK97 family phage prohead protease
MYPTTTERRSAATLCEVRENTDSPSVFVGRAVVYNEWSELLFGAFRERIAPGAFDESLSRGTDVYASVNHDEERVLGRLSSGTLRMKPADDGITVEVDAGDYTYARDLCVAIRRGDLRGMSFIFDVLEDNWETRDGVPHRTVTKADIYEVSFVYFPAYEQTDAGMRQRSVSRVPVRLSLAFRKRQLALRERDMDSLCREVKELHQRLDDLEGGDGAATPKKPAAVAIDDPAPKPVAPKKPKV